LGKEASALVRYSYLWIQFVRGAVVSLPDVRSDKKLNVVDSS
jgi:hypothetical protein